MMKLFLLVCFTVNVLVGSIPLDETAIEGRIAGGDDTDISKFPHHVALRYFQASLGGGFIVSPTHILTAADNIDFVGDTEVTVRAGSSSNEDGGVIIQSKKVYLHPKFNHTTHDYNVGIVELETPLKFNDKTIKPIKLAAKEPSVGTAASTCGWGWINEYTDEPETLQGVTIPIIDRTKCANAYKPENATITPRMICAGGNGKTVYFGDSGGALVINGEAVGIADFLIKFGPWYQRSPKLPGVFASIADPEINKFIKGIVKL